MQEREKREYVSKDHLELEQKIGRASERCSQRESERKGEEIERD